MIKSNKLKNRKTIHIEWGDCDPAQIVYFPRYFFYFDGCTAALFKKAGLSKRELIKRYKIVGIPLVDVRASFMQPSRLSESVTIESEITEWRRSSFCVRHRLFNKGKLAVECIEIRVWAALSRGDSDKTDPPDVISMFSGGSTLTGRIPSKRTTLRGGPRSGPAGNAYHGYQ